MPRRLDQRQRGILLSDLRPLLTMTAPRFEGRIQVMWSLTANLAHNAGAAVRRAIAFRWFAFILIALTPIGGCTPRPAGPATAGGPSSPSGATNSASGNAAPVASPAEAKVRSNPNDLAARQALADDYFRAGESFAGIEQLEAARALGDHNPQHLRDLAQRYDALNEPEAAADLLASSADGTPETAQLLSGITLKLGDFARSATALRPLLKSWATLPPAIQQAVVRALLLAGDAEAAAPLLPHSANDADWLGLVGLQATLAGKPAQAADAYTKALTLTPTDTWTAALLGQALLAAGRQDRALAIWSQVAQAQDPPPQALIGLARLQANAGQLDQADALLDHVQGEDHKQPAYWQTVALVAGKRHHDVVQRIALGYAAYNQGDPWRAEAIWQGALAQADDVLARQALAALSNSAARRQNGQVALRYAATAAKRWPQDPECLRQYADMLLEQSQLKEALAVAQRLQSIAPPERQAQAAELLSRIALDSSQPDLLKQNVQRGRELAPADPIPLLRLAEWQGQQGHDTANLERTLALYEEARRIAPDNAEATARAGLILADLKRTDEAIATLLHALSLNPRVLDGAPNALLTQLYAQQGRTWESRFEAQWYQRIRALKDPWPSLLKSLRQEHPAPSSADWKALGEMALRRHENWIALCAFTRYVRLSDAAPAAWRDLAAAQKRFAWFDEALASMRRAHQLSLFRDMRVKQ
jgi:tetratricopeptide (TPR) repeat protein